LADELQSGYAPGLEYGARGFATGNDKRPNYICEGRRNCSQSGDERPSD
jgi:hypothetical protein